MKLTELKMGESKVYDVEDNAGLEPVIKPDALFGPKMQKPLYKQKGHLIKSEFAPLGCDCEVCQLKRNELKADPQPVWQPSQIKKNEFPRF
jgi:hypothetical protein